MGDLRERLGVLDSVTPPDQWEEIRSGTPRVSRDGPSIGRRVAVTAAALLVFGGGLTLVALAFMGPNLQQTGPALPGPTGRSTGQSPVPSPKPIEVSAVSKDGKLQCTVSLPSDVVEPGEPTGISYTLQNLGSRAVDYAFYAQSGLVVVDAEGKTLWDSGRVAPVPGPYSPPGHLPPGAQVELRSSDTLIRWPGPLTLRTTCDNGRVRLSPFGIDVVVPGPTPATADAITRAASRTGGLFDDCRAGLDGSTVVGLIHAPGDTTIPPMRARCSATVMRYSGFVMVSLTFVTPPEAPPFSIPESLFGVPLPQFPSMEAARVDFVVTASAVREVVPLEAAFRSRPADRMVRDIELRNGQLSKSGESLCGSEGWGAAIEFISVCPA